MSDEKPKYRVKLVESKEIAKDTMMFLWQKPDEFTFSAGSSMDWTLINPPETDPEGNMRSFTIVTAPYEEYFGFTTRMRDTAFKRSLKKLHQGDEIESSGPWDYTLHDDTNIPAVFLVGGIGITPFHSMIKQVTHDKKPYRMFLFYANKTPDDAVFLDELQSLAKENSQFTFVPIMTRDDNWTGEKGHIDRALLEKYGVQLDRDIFYSAGPPEMVATMKKILTENNVPEDRIRTEDFTGY